eukprot:5660907-Pyramimonas_sp.AAC.1
MAACVAQATGSSRSARQLIFRSAKQTLREHRRTGSHFSKPNEHHVARPLGEPAPAAKNSGESRADRTDQRSGIN